MSSENSKFRLNSSGSKDKMLDVSVGVNPPQFLADFLITHIKPSIETIRRKIGNGYLQSRILHLFPPNEIPDFVTFAKQNQLTIIHNMKGNLPSWFNEDQYIARLQTQLESFLERNKDVYNTVEELRAQPDFSNPDDAKIFRDAIVLLGDKMGKWYLAYEQFCADLFLVSDIPVDYFLVSKDAELSQLSSYKIYSKNMGKLDTRLRVARNFVKFSHYAGEFKNELSPLLGSGRLVSDSLARVNFFLDVSNASNIDEMFHLTPYLASRTNVERLNQLTQELELSLASMKEQLIAQQGYVHDQVILSQSTNHLEEDLANIVVA